MGVYLRAKFEVSSIILTSFRQGGNFTPLPTSKRTPKKPTQIRVNAFKNGTISLQPTEYTGNPDKLAWVAKVSHYSSLEIFTPKQMLQWLQILLPQVRAVNTFEIHQFVYYLYLAK